MTFEGRTSETLPVSWVGAQPSSVKIIQCHAARR